MSADTPLVSADTPPPSQLAQAWARIEAGDPLGAAALLEADASPEARHVLGYAYTLAGCFDEARRIYRQLWEEARAQRQPAAHRSLHQLGMVEREAGDYRAALELFEEEYELIRQGNLGPLERAVNGYERAVCLLALDELSDAQAVLSAALADAQEAGDPMTTGCLWRAAGDLAASQGWHAQAYSAYAASRHHFTDAGDERAVQELDSRLAGLG